MLHDYYTIDENDETGHARYHWEVYIPQGQHDQPDSYRMARMDKHKPKAKHSNMDSPTVKEGGQRKLVETALLHMFQTGQVTYTVNKMPRVFIRRHAPVDKQPSAKRQRLNVELYPIAVDFPKNETFLVDFILDQDAPVRYQVAAPHATFDDLSTWQVLIFRRLNPRATKNLQYGMRLMSAGRGKVADKYSDASVTAMQYHVDSLLALAAIGSKLATTLSVAKQQIQRLDKTYIASKDFSEDTISYRLKQHALAIGSAFFELHKNPSQENIGRWTALRDNIIANRERLEPKMSAHIAGLERNAIAKAAEKDRKALALHNATQTTTAGAIPPFPYHLAGQAQTAPQAAIAPANGTGNPLTAFLGGALEPVAWPYQEPAHDVIKPLEEGEVVAWLKSIEGKTVEQMHAEHLASKNIPDTPAIPPVVKPHTLADLPDWRAQLEERLRQENDNA